MMMLVNSVNFKQFASEFPEVKACYDETAEGVYYETMHESLAYTRPAEGDDRGAYVLVVACSDPERVIITNAYEASGEDFLMMNPTADKLRDLFKWLEEIHPSYEQISMRFWYEFGRPIASY